MTEQIFYRAGYKYQLAADYRTRVPIHPVSPIETDWLRLSPNGTLEIRKGYAWDGPSGPTIDTASAMRGSLVHDSIYQMIRLGLLAPELRETADRVYEDACIEDGMWPARAWLHFKALRAFGAGAAEPSAEKPILTAP